MSRASRETDATEREALFEHLGDLLTGSTDRVTRSTMMGFPCLRLDGAFFACIERSTGNLIVKLPAERVNELVKTAPAGRSRLTAASSRNGSPAQHPIANCGSIC